jgi:hypothetical protein
VIGEADHDTVLERARRRVLDRLSRVLIHDAKNGVERLAGGLPLRPAGQRFGDGVQVSDPAVDVGGDDRVADTRERDPQQLSALTGARLRRPHRLADPDDE